MPLAEQQVWTKLKECYDPELPCNIVDLGLVYEVKVSPLEDSDDTRVDVRMTLTSQGCPMSKQILAQVQQKLLDLKGVGEANVEIVYDPPWNLSKINEEGKKKLGLSYSISTNHIA
ncbi:MAG: iron-sulfur cluster assembly protein [Verrucomicrobiia bacterium]